MIPQFPIFKKIEITDRLEIKNFTRKDEPYSDFDFTTLWMWDIYGKRGWAELDGNLVVKFTSYLDNKEFYSIYGSHKISKAIRTLLDFLVSQQKPATLCLIPESVVKAMTDKEKFSIEEDKDNFDYVYAINNLVSYPGYSYAQPRKMMNKFINKYENVEIVPLDLERHQEQIMELVADWEKGKNFGKYDERKAFEKLMENADDFPLLNVGVMIDEKLAAFNVNEVIDDRFAISHFAKANIEYVGIYSYLMRETANVLAFQGCKFLNCEQDLGIEGLRYAKGSYRPEFFLKKYIVKAID